MTKLYLREVTGYGQKVKSGCFIVDTKEDLDFLSPLERSCFIPNWSNLKLICLAGVALGTLDADAISIDDILDYENNGAILHWNSLFVSDNGKKFRSKYSTSPNGLMAVQYFFKGLGLFADLVCELKKVHVYCESDNYLNLFSVIEKLNINKLPIYQSMYVEKNVFSLIAENYILSHPPKHKFEYHRNKMYVNRIERQNRITEMQAQNDMTIINDMLVKNNKRLRNALKKGFDIEVESFDESIAILSMAKNTPKNITYLEDTHQSTKQAQVSNETPLIKDVTLVDVRHPKAVEPKKEKISNTTQSNANAAKSASNVVDVVEVPKNKEVSSASMPIKAESISTPKPPVESIPAVEISSPRQSSQIIQMESPDDEVDSSEMPKRELTIYEKAALAAEEDPELAALFDTSNWDI